jgi:sulfoxide reductase heme-binding subunit YedZ
MKQRQWRTASIVINILALLPLVWLGVDAWLGRLSADPVTFVQDRTGLYAIALLALSLMASPLYWALGFGWLWQMRRLAGLYAFGYATLHLVNLVWLDYDFNLTFLYDDALFKRYIIVGMAAFILLIPLAITSTAGWRRRLGLGWRRLHYLVYPAAILAAVHYIWQAKIDIRLPLVFTIFIVLLVLLRLPFIRKVIDRYGRRRAEAG